MLRLYFMLTALLLIPATLRGADHIHDLQGKAVQDKKSAVGHWGAKPEEYTEWGTHSNRLVPIYTFGTRGHGGCDLSNFTGDKSPYRSKEAIIRLFGDLPKATLNAGAVYADQTNVYDIQKAALAQGKRHIFVVVFDGMDWDTTRAAAIHQAGKVGYDSGRGSGLHFQDYTADGTSQFGFFVSSPFSNKGKVDVNKQKVQTLGKPRGGYDAKRGGDAPWGDPQDPLYLTARPKESPNRHAYTDSASSATSMCAGIKTYNGSINIGPQGKQVTTIAHVAQKSGYRVGAVSSVPVSHATPAASYAHNVSRSDYQDLTRDLVGLKSVSHRQIPLQGLDVLIGGGFGAKKDKDKDKAQGDNFVPGNGYITADDLKAIDVANGGKYVVSVRTKEVDGGEALQAAAEKAVAAKKRLFGLYGMGANNGHLPFQTADGNYRPAPGRKNKKETYQKNDLLENPTLAEMTAAAIRVMEGNSKGFWLMVEAGDVDWANHDNNLDNSIGAVKSGDDAVKVITDWVEKNSNWKDSLLIVTADHGHQLVLKKPEMLLPGK